MSPSREEAPVVTATRCPEIPRFPRLPKGFLEFPEKFRREVFFKVHVMIEVNCCHFGGAHSLNPQISSVTVVCRYVGALCPLVRASLFIMIISAAATALLDTNADANADQAAGGGNMVCF